MTEETPKKEARVMQFLLDLPRTDHVSRRNLIHAHLVETLQPGSFYETLRVQEMAIAWLEISDLRERIDSLRSFLRTQAAERFETATRKHYEQLNRDLLKSHGANQTALAAHTYGARMLAAQWEAFRERLYGRGWMDLVLIFKTLVSEGHSDRIQDLECESLEVVAKIIKLTGEPESVIDDWMKICRIREDERKQYFFRVMEHYNQVESNVSATRDLDELCHSRIQFWHAEAERLKPEHEQQKEAFCDGFTSYPGVTSSIRTLISLQKIQFARIAKLEKELRALKREAEKDEERRQKHQARLEAIRNGIAPPRSPRKRAETPNPPVFRESNTIVFESKEEQFQYPYATSVQENESAAGAGEQPADSFPERELVEAVLRTADEIENYTTNNRTEADATEELKSSRSDSIAGRSEREQEYRKIISHMSDHHLVRPQKNDSFVQLYGKASRERRKLLRRLLTEERLSRSVTQNFQPSG